METTQESISKLDCIDVNGNTQWYFARGNINQDKIILFLHGGPGFAQMSFSHTFFKKLEKDYLLIDWDQRASGKSYNKKIVINNLTLEDYVEDTIAISKLLKEKFNKDKIILIGHSWGCTLGLYTIKKCPQLFTAFIGTGFGVDYQEGEKYSFNYLIKMAKNAHDKKAIEELEEIEFPITENTFEKNIKIKSKYMNKYGGYFYAKISKLLLKALPQMIFHPVYRVKDYINMMNGMKNGKQIGMKVLLKLNIMKNMVKIDVPMYFFIGKHDYHTPFELTQMYYEKVVTPYKEWVWFNKSAHSPLFEECNVFCNEIQRVIEEKKWLTSA